MSNQLTRTLMEAALQMEYGDWLFSTVVDTETTIVIVQLDYVNEKAAFR